MKKRTRKAVAATPETRPPQPDPAESTPAPLSWRRHAWRVLALWIIALAAYSNSFRSGLVKDNAVIIGQDTRIRALTSQNLHLILSEELWYNSSTTNLYRPLATFSYLVNYVIFKNGLHPGGYHWVNFLLHAANILVVYLLGGLVFRKTTMAWVLAALWGVHPLLTESVTNIIGRADLLAGFGVLAGLLCHIQAGRSAGRRQLVWLAALAATAGIGIFSKESAAVLPGILLLYDLTWNPAAGWNHRWKSYVALALPFAVFFKLRADLLASHFVEVVPFVDNPLVGADFITARLTAIKVIGKYLWLFLWPGRLSSDYSYDAVPLFGWQINRWGDLSAILALAVCLGLVALALRFYGGRKPAFFFILFFFVTLAPVANVFILIGSIMAERFLYLPLVGLTGCLVAGGYEAARLLGSRWPRSPRIAGALVVLVCAALALRTFIRNFDWATPTTLGSSEVAAEPRDFKAHMFLVGALLASNPPQLDRAASESDRMLAILQELPVDETVSRAYEVAARGFRTKGDGLNPSGNVADPNSPAAFWYRKALAVLLRGQEADRADKERVREVNQEAGKSAVTVGWIPLYLELGRVYRRLGQTQQAIEALVEGRLEQSDDEFSEEISEIRLSAGDREQAAVSLMEGLVFNPNSSKLAADLVDLYRKTEPGSCAVQSSGKVSVNLACPLVHDQLCTASRNVAMSYAKRGDRAKTTATARTAVQELGCSVQLFR